MIRRLFLILSLLNLSSFAFAQGDRIREPAVAGTFYPADSTNLDKMISAFLKQAKVVEQTGDIIGIIAPHAGYIYSGIVASQGYKQLIGKHYETVIVISPSHVEYFPFSSILPNGSYKTPLGTIKIDSELAQEIARNHSSIHLSERGHIQTNLPRQEHALEVQLPLLQKVLGNFQLVPIVMGEQNLSACEELADAIFNSTKKRHVLIVASSDLSHFHPYEKAKKIDQNCLALIEQMDYDKMYRQLQAHKIEACGGGPIIAMLMAAKKKGANQTRILMYANTGDVGGDRNRVVGYGSAIVTKENKKHNSTNGTESSLYSVDEEKELLKIARTAIEYAVQKKPNPSFSVTSEKLKQHRGAFVTINKFGQLRGCIGFIEPVLPLYQAVNYVAVSAALKDPRFSPVQPDELPYLNVEISVLTVPIKIKNKDDIIVGKHGLIVKKGNTQGLLLPQVATEYNWDRVTFLEKACEKAGLDKNEWKKSDTEIYIFSAEVFNQQQIQ